MQQQALRLSKPKKEKKVTIRPPEARLQVKFYREALRDLRANNRIKKTNLIHSCISPVLVINHMVWENLENLYREDEQKFLRHCTEGLPFELLTNSIQLTTRIFYSYLYIEGALDSEHPTFKSCRSLWYKTIRPFLLDCGYITEVKNFRAGNYSTECDDGRGNFKLVINIKDFMFGIDLQIGQGNAASDDINFLCPVEPLDIFYSYSQNSFHSPNEMRNKVESHESGEATPPSSCPSDNKKKLEVLAKQVMPPSEIQKNGGQMSKNVAPDVEKKSDTSPKVDNSSVIVNFSGKLSKLFLKCLFKKEFLNEKQIRIRQNIPLDTLTSRDYSTDFVQLLKHCRQDDELDYSPAFERLKKIIQDKADWLRKDRNRWMYTPDQYLSTQKYNGTDDFLMKEGSIRAYHDRYTVHIRERITPSVSGEIETLLDTYYPTLKGFGVSDKFLKEWIDKLGKENFVNELRRCFARLSQGFKPLSKSEYVRRSIRNCYADLVKEKADFQVKKAAIVHSSPVGKPFKPSENQIKDWLQKLFGKDAELFGKIQLYALRTNSTTPELLKSEAHRLLQNIKQAEKERETVDMLLDRHKGTIEDVERINVPHYTPAPYGEGLARSIEQSPKSGGGTMSDNEAQNVKNAIEKAQKERTTIRTANEKVESDLITFEEIDATYNKHISEGEKIAFVWYMRNVLRRPMEGGWKKYHRNMDSSQLAKMVKEGVLMYEKGTLIPAFMYFSGNIYQKFSQLERDKDEIIEKYGEGAYEAQQTHLKAIKDEIYGKRMILDAPNPDDRLKILPTSEFAQKFKIKFLKDEVEIRANVLSKGVAWNNDVEKNFTTFKEASLQEAFIFWMKNNSAKIPFRFGLDWLTIYELGVYDKKYVKSGDKDDDDTAEKEEGSIMISSCYQKPD